eukprot:1007821-Lingulodinium_polyedra.AAC.1
MTGKFWPWVKARKAELQGAEATSQLQALIQDAEASAAAADAEVAQSLAGDKQDMPGKLQVAFREQIQ